MRAASLLVVLLLAKTAVLWGRTPPVPVWALAAYGWQDVAVAAAFGVWEAVLRVRASRLTGISAAAYWALAIYAAINIPIGRVVSTPLTWPMLRAARGPLADSMLLYVTWTNAVLVAATLMAAAILPRLLRRVPMIAATCLLPVLLVGPAAAARVDTHGMDRNVVVALIESGLPRIGAKAGAADWRASRFAGANTDDLSRLRGIAKGRNVVVISLESTAAQYLSLYGGTPDVMPHLTELARNALVFDNAYAVYPESIKGLFSVLCSTFPAFDSEPEAYEKVPCRPVAAVLADAGYRTALFHSGRFAYLGMESIIRNRGYQVLEDAGDIGGNHHSSFGVDEPATVARMLAWIDALPPGRRFFLTYLPIAGHHPYAAPDGGPFAVHSEIDQYRNALHYGDVSLGTLIEGLRARGLEDNTLWVVYGDHGEAFGQHTGNYGHTFFVYEENVHVPLVIAAPGLLRSQQRVRRVVSLVDTAPTILDLVGLAVPAGYQGRSILDPAPRMALFFADYSLGILGLRDGPWKFIYEIESRHRKLFRLDRDPRETEDAAGSDPARSAWYAAVLRDWSGAQKSYIASR